MSFYRIYDIDNNTIVKDIVEASSLEEAEKISEYVKSLPSLLWGFVDIEEIRD